MKVTDFHSELKKYRKNNNIKKNAKVIFRTESGYFTFESVAVDTSMIKTIDLYDVCDIYSGEALLIEELTSNPYEYPKYKSINKMMKYVKSSIPEQYEKQRLVIKCLDSSYHIVSGFYYDDEDIYVSCMKLLSTEIEEGES